MYRIISYHSTRIYKWDIHFLSRSVTKDPFRVGRAEHRMHGFKFRIDPGLERAKCWRSVAIITLYLVCSRIRREIRICWSAVLAHGWIEVGSFLSSSDLVIYTTYFPSRRVTIINLTPRRQKSARCIKRTDIFHSCPLFYTHTHTHTPFSSLPSHAVYSRFYRCIECTALCASCFLVNYDRRSNKSLRRFILSQSANFLAVCSKTRIDRLNNPLPRFVSF